MCQSHYFELWRGKSKALPGRLATYKQSPLSHSFKHYDPLIVKLLEPSLGDGGWTHLFCMSRACTICTCNVQRQKFRQKSFYISIIVWPPTRDVQTNGKTASASSSCEDDKEERMLSDEQYDLSVASTERKTNERVEHQRQRDEESEKRKAEQEAAKQRYASCFCAHLHAKLTHLLSPCRK